MGDESARISVDAGGVRVSWLVLGALYALVCTVLAVPLTAAVTTSVLLYSGVSEQRPPAPMPDAPAWRHYVVFDGDKQTHWFRYMEDYTYLVDHNYVPSAMPGDVFVNTDAL